nr:phage tail tape measure protein [Paenibacillus roseus]
MSETRDNIDKLAATLDNVNARADIQRRKLVDLQRQYKETFDDGAKAKINDKIVSTEAALLSLTKQSDVTASKIHELEDSFNSAGDGLDKFDGKATSTVTKLGVAFAALTAAYAAVITKSVEAAATFEQSMAKVKAVSGATASEFKRLQDQALELGATTVFTAGQAADAQGYLAVAGFKTNEIIEAMPGVLNLAAAAQMDLGRTADIASNILTGFQLKAEETGRVTDVLAKAFTSSNTSMEQLGYAMKYAAPIAASTGVTIEQTAAAIGRLSDAGIQGEMAGTQLRAIILRLIKPVGEAKDVMDQLGIKTKDAAGNILPFTDIIRQLEVALGGLTQSAQTEAAALIAGTEATAGLLTLVNAGSDNLNEFAEQLRNAGGTAEQIAETQMDTFNGAVVQMKSALEAVGITVGNDFIPILRQAAEAVTRALLGFNEMSDGSRTFIIALLGVTVGLGALSTAAAGAVIAFKALAVAGVSAQAALGFFVAIPAAIGLAAAAFISYKTTAAAAAEAQAEFNAQLAKSPLENTAEDVETLRGRVEELEKALTRRNEILAELNNMSALRGGYGMSEGLQELADKSRKLGQELADLNNKLEVFGVKTPDDAARRLDEMNAKIEASIPALNELLREELAEAAAKQEQITQSEKLLDRYQELSQQTSLTADEKSELTRVIQQLSDQYPELSAKLDENGRLMIMNEGNVRNLIQAEKDSVQATLDSATSRSDAWRLETEKKLEYAKKQLEALRAVSQAESFDGSGTNPYGFTGSGAFGLSGTVKQMLEDDRKKLEAEVGTYTKTINDMDLQLAKIRNGTWSESDTGGGLSTGTGTLNLKKDKKDKKPKDKKDKPAERLAQEAYRASLQYIEKMRLQNRMSEEQELAKLDELAKKYEKFDDIWIDATKRRNQLSDQMAAADKKRTDDEKKQAEESKRVAEKQARDKFDASAEWIEMETRRLTEKGASEREITNMQLAAWTRVRNRYEKDSDFYKRADKEMFNARMSLRKQDEQAAKEAAQAAEKSTKELTKSIVDAIDKQRKAELDALEERKQAIKNHYDEMLRIIDDFERGKDRKKIEDEADKYRYATSEKGRKRYEELQEQLRKMDVDDNKRALQQERDDKLAALDKQKADIDSWYADLKSSIENFNGDFISIYKLTDDERFKSFVDTNERIKAEMERFKAEMAAINAGAGSGTDPYQQSIIRQMRANSEAWKSADAAGRKRLEDENKRLGSQVGATYNSGEGRWYKDGAPLYHTGGIAGERPFSSGQRLMPDELTAILRKGEVTLTPEQISQLVGGNAGLAPVGNMVHIETLVGVQMNEPVIEDNVDIAAYRRNGADEVAELLRKKLTGGDGG